MSTTKYPHYPEDFRLAVYVSPGHTYEWSSVLLARARINGTLEFLTSAWEKLLGYGRDEFAGKKLSQLTGLGRSTATTAAAIFDRGNPEPVELRVSCRLGRPIRLKLHRRFDSDERTVFIVAEVAPENLAGGLSREPAKS